MPNVKQNTQYPTLTGERVIKSKRYSPVGLRVRGELAVQLAGGHTLIPV